MNLKPLAENVWLLTYPLHLLGVDLHRNVTVLRLASGRLIIHSTAPFTTEDIAAIHAVGEPGWIVDAMLRHDTFARQGRVAFPDIPYLAPEGFSENAHVATSPLVPPPPEWAGEVEVHEIEGVPDLRETVFLHRPSRTLIVCDLLMNFAEEQPFWTELALKAAVGPHHAPGVPRTVKFSVDDERAFNASVARILSWDFNRIVVGHGDVIETGGKAKVQGALLVAGLA